MQEEDTRHRLAFDLPDGGLVTGETRADPPARSAANHFCRHEASLRFREPKVVHRPRQRNAPGCRSIRECRHVREVAKTSEKPPPSGQTSNHLGRISLSVSSENVDRQLTVPAATAA